MLAGTRAEHESYLNVAGYECKSWRDPLDVDPMVKSTLLADALDGSGGSFRNSVFESG